MAIRRLPDGRAPTAGAGSGAAAGRGLAVPLLDADLRQDHIDPAAASNPTVPPVATSQRRDVRLGSGTNNGSSDGLAWVSSFQVNSAL